MHSNSEDNQVYFEAKCVIDPASLAALGGSAVAKLTKFCRDSSLSVYLIVFMENGQKTEHSLFLTKQRLIPSTGYCCGSGHLGVRRFASVEVLVANTVKRVMPKSDSKFIEKFSLLLEPNTLYCRQVSASHVLFFETHREGTVEFWHERVEAAAKASSRIIAIKPRGLFKDESEDRMADSRESKVKKLLSSGETFKTPRLPLNPAEMEVCQINPPNILCSLWNQPPLIVKYFQKKALEGNKEEGECIVATVTNKKAPANSETVTIQGFGTIVIPPDSEESVTEKEKEKNSSMTQTCESTPEQPRGYASKLSDQEHSDSESQDLEEATSKAIAQTMALISSGTKRVADDSCLFIMRFRQLKKKLAPGRRFTLF